MIRKLFFLVLLRALVLVTVHGDDDFKERDNMDEVEDMVEVENDEESETRQPRSSIFRNIRFSIITKRRRSRFRFRFFRKPSPRLSVRRRSRTSTRRASNGNSGGGTDKWTKIGTVVSIAQLGVNSSKLILDTMSNAKRKILVTLGNLGKISWRGGSVYMKQGSLLETIPNPVDKDNAATLGAEKKTGPSTTGVSGVVCYRFQIVGNSFCVMFKIPYSGDNYWNVKIYDKEKLASEEVYNDLQSGAIKAGTPVEKKKIWSGNGNAIYIKDCSMTTSGQSILHVSVEMKKT